MRRQALRALTYSGVFALVVIATLRLPAAGGWLFVAQVAVALAIWLPLHRWAARDAVTAPPPSVWAGFDPADPAVTAAFLMRASPMLAAIAAERQAQDLKWGEQNHPDGTGLIMFGYPAVELADMFRRYCQRNAANGTLRWSDVLSEEFYELLAETDPERIREELVQVAAVAVAWAEAIDRRRDRAENVDV